MSISASLQKAIALQEKIDQMRVQLAGLLSQVRQELAGTPAPEAAPKTRRRRRRPAAVAKAPVTLPRVAQARAAAAAPPAKEALKAARGENKPKASSKGKGKSKGRSSLAGQKRASSPSGPLAPAVVKVLEGNGEPMRVAEILAGLLNDGYSFNSAEPRKNLAARIYRLSGVRQVEPGLFYTA